MLKKALSVSACVLALMAASCDDDPASSGGNNTPTASYVEFVANDVTYRTENIVAFAVTGQQIKVDAIDENYSWQMTIQVAGSTAGTYNLTNGGLMWSAPDSVTYIASLNFADDGAAAEIVYTQTADGLIGTFTGTAVLPPYEPMEITSGVIHINESDVLRG